MSDRGTGKTTRAMLAAPQNAVFVWVNHHLDYPKALAAFLKRDDLQIVSPNWLIDEQRWMAKTFTALVLDPDTRLDNRQWEKWHMAKHRVRK